MPPRNVNVLQGGGYVPGIPNNHRTPTQPSQGPMVSQPTQFLPQRGQNNYGFNGGLGQHQANALQQQVNGASNSLPPHLQTPNLPSAQAVSSTTEVGLDPNDFPALGSTSANNNNGNGNNNGSGGSTTSYASQAGTGVGLGSGASIGGAAAGAANQQRDFTPDDFPALGGQTQTQTTQDGSHSHPPGLNGFPQHSEHSQQQQHRQNLLGALSGGLPQGTPGMLNLSPAQARTVHPGFQQQHQHTDAEKQQQRVCLVSIPASFALTPSRMTE
jgi:CCR4-NOT transcription complex subunit 2